MRIMMMNDYDDEIQKITSFLKSNVGNMKKPTDLRKNEWSKHPDWIKEAGLEVDILHGRCFVASKFVQHYFGKDKLELRCIKPPFTYVVLPNGKELKTVHWFLKDQQDNVLDLTDGQFKYGHKPDYSKSVKSDMAYPYFGKKGSGLIYEETVPSLEVIRLAKIFKQEYGSANGLDFWIKQHDDYYQKKSLQTMSINV